MKRMLALVLCVLLLPIAALCETAPAYDPLTLGGPAPYTAVPGALSEDGMSYDDGTLKVRIETEQVEGVNVYYVYVSILDKSQLRTATAGSPRSKVTAPVYAMAEANNAVLAFNGDFYNYRDAGVVYRSGERIRNSIRKGLDMLIVDEAGDMHIIDSPTQGKIDAFLQEHQIVEAFSFGPAFIKDGEKLVFKYQDKNSCGYNNKDERLVACQLPDADGFKQYLFIACDGINDKIDTGLTGRQVTDLALEKGALVAYNLDGGTSTAIYLCGERKNIMSKDREVGDIIYFATLVPSENP